MHLVVFNLGKGLGNGNDHSVGGDETGVQDCRLIVEIKFVNAGEIVTNDAYGLFHSSLADDDVPVGITDIIHRRSAGSGLEAVRIIHGLAGCQHGQTHDDTNIFSHSVHGFSN